MTDFRRKKIRLSAANYVGQRFYFVTACCHDRVAHFSVPETASWMVDEMQRACMQFSFLLHAYCVMPDHIHMLVEGGAPTSNLLTFGAQFKRRTGQLWQKRHPSKLWQHRYYDHILRTKDSPEAVAWYIWLNPLRKGLCQRTDQYPFLGSFTPMKDIQKSVALEWSPPWKA